MKLCPGSMGVRHFVPLAFVLSLVGLSILGCLHPIFWALLSAELLLYIAMDIAFSVKQAASAKEAMMMLLLFPIFHVSYGAGSVVGIAKLFTKTFRSNQYKNKKI